MSHEIHREKFISYERPAWHGLGTVIEEEIGAVEAGRRLKLPKVTTEPVVTASGIQTDHQAIIGLEELDEGGTQTVIYDVVTNQYHAITHEDFLEAWDRGTDGQAHIETIGLLYNGSTLFVTTKLPDFAVKGDEVEAYLLAYNPLRAGRAVTVRKTPVRVVCHNTLQASGQRFTAEWRVIHTSDAAKQLEEFVRAMYAKAVDEYRAVKEFYEVMAGKHLTDDEARQGLKRVYREPEMPVKLETLDSNDDATLNLLAGWERAKGAAIEHRDECFALYGGDGRGSMSEAAKGTAWGAYNAVVEYEQHLKRFRQPQSVVFGAGRNRVARAYNVFGELAGLEPEPEGDEVAAS